MVNWNSHEILFVVPASSACAGDSHAHKRCSGMDTAPRTAPKQGITDRLLDLSTRRVTMPRPQAAAKAAHACEAAGCTAVLAGNDYYSRRRLCAAHAKADAVCRRGHGSALFRWCQQCGRLEPLALFEGVKRSCRASLERRRAQASGKPLLMGQPLGTPGAASPSNDSSDAPVSLALAEAPHAAAAAAWQQPSIAAVGGRADAPPACGGHMSGADQPSSFGASAGAGVVTVALQAAAGAWAEPAAALLGAGQGWLQHTATLDGDGAMLALPLGAAVASSQPVPVLSEAEVDELVQSLLGAQAQDAHQPQLLAPSFGPGSTGAGSAACSSDASLLAGASVAAQLEAALEQELRAAAAAVHAAVGRTSSLHSCSSTVGTLPPPACAPVAPQLPAATAADPFQPPWCHQGTGLHGAVAAPAAWLASFAAVDTAPAAGAGSSAGIRAHLQALQAQARCVRAMLQQLRAEYASLTG